jgi:NAD(P)-dependent dehydrogenase (short-subunit alcohol dehydrogenase family)
MTRLESKNIIVAGGGTGIGAGTAKRLASEGANVIVGDLSLERAEAVAYDIVASGGQAIGRAFDLVDESTVERLIQSSIDQFGGLDGIHINAADLVAHRQDYDVLTVDMAIFDRVMAVNLRGHFLCTRYALPAMLERGGGSIVYTSSAAAYIGEPKRVSYAMSKSGVHALMRHVATGWGKQNIRANVVCPGMVPTEANWDAPASRFEKALKGHRSPRLGKPEDIAGMVALLMSSDGEWINGQVINVDGGVTLRP